MKQKKTLSLKARVLMIALSVVAFMILFYLLMTHWLWERFYLNRAQQSIIHTHMEISELVRTGNPSSDELIRVISKDNLGIQIQFAMQGDRDWDFTVVTKNLISDRDRAFLLSRLQENFLVVREERSNLTIVESTDEYTIQKVDLGDDGTYLECYGYLQTKTGDSKKFILSMALQNISRIRSTSSGFFIWTSLGILVLLLLISWFFTNRITKPIYQLHKLSERIKNLDFEARYEGNKNDEIGQLGQNMNELSSQLQKTISELQQANNQLQKDLKEKEEIDEMRRDFISNVSHELKTPIGLIEGYAEGLQDVKDDPEQFSYYCHVISDEAVKMNEMVKRLTALNQIEYGEAALTPETFDLMEMTRNIVGSYRVQANEKNAQILLEETGEKIVYADAFKIEEVIQNYLSNALNHLEEPNEIRIFFEERDEKIRFVITNTGRPIPEEELEKIWIKFYKVDKARTRMYGGSGIGLSIVRAILKAHSEQCGVYNLENGVAFWFELKKDKEHGAN